jgi:hypothetical protein
MGASISVFVAHSISDYMHRHLLPSATSNLTYIDNWYSAGNNVKAYDLCPGELSENSCGTKLTILGLDVDCVEKTIRLGEKYYRHIEFLKQAMERELSHAEMWKILGIVFRFVQVANRPLHDMYYMLCMIRRASRQLALDEETTWEKPIHVSPAEKRQLKELVTEACEMKTYKLSAIQTPTAPTVIFTDASAHSWGVVRLEKSTMHVSSGPLSPMPIHEGEALAVTEGLATCERGKAVAIIVDNTIVAQAVQRGHSTNKVVNELCDLIAHWDHPISIAWVPSEENWADGPSRGREVRLDEIQALEFRPAKQWLSVCVAANKNIPAIVDCHE